MDFPNKEFLESFIFHELFSCGEVTVLSEVTSDYCQTLQRSSFEMYAYKNCDIDIRRATAWIYTRIYNNLIIIDDFQSRVMYSGNGTKLFLDLLRCIVQINKSYQISKMVGFLSWVDFERWDMLIHFYSHINRHITLCDDLPIKLDFKLINYTIEEILQNMEQHRNKSIDFEIFIDYI